MPDRKAEAMWNGDLKSGNGNLKLGSGMFEGAYSFVSRFEDGEGTNPEELIAAAHAVATQWHYQTNLQRQVMIPRA